MTSLYRFGQFVLDQGRRTLSRVDSPVSLTPKAFDVLLFLAQNPNRLVTKEELLQAVWGDTFVEDLADRSDLHNQYAMFWAGGD